MKVTKLDKARQIVAVLYGLPELPDPETTSAPIKRDIARFRRKTNKQLERDWQLANKILHGRSAGELE